MENANEILKDMNELQKCIVLLLNSKNNEAIRGNTWFQKELFLIAQNIPELAREAAFESDFYEPFSESAEEELGNLEMDDIVVKQGNRMALSDEGKEVAEILEKKTSKKNLEIIADFKELINDLTDDEVLTLVYLSSPDFTDESKVLKDIMHNRKNVAIKLYKKGKVSLQKAAQMAGISLEKLVKEME
jgi:hypothetical protein